MFIGFFKCCLFIFFGIQNLFGEEVNPLDHAIISIYAIDGSNGKVLINHNSNLSMIPASCMKIITTSAALHLLGPEARFETHLAYDGYLDEEKTLNGNLYIHGTGDPVLGSDRIPGNPSWERQIQIWAEAIKNLNIKKITGKIIGDATEWESAFAVPSWQWEDLGNAYGAGASALSFHENNYSLVFKPGKKEGDNTTITKANPPISLMFHNEVKTGPVGSGDRICIYGSEYSPVQIIRGTIPLSVTEFIMKGAIPDPPAFCANLLLNQLNEITVEQRVLTWQKERKILHTTYSPTIKEIVFWTNQKSINLYAEHLLKRMGKVTYHDGSTDSGIKAVTGFLLSQGINLSGFNMADGSGLSRKNLVTAKQFVDILLKIKQSEIFPIFIASLPDISDLVKAKSGSMTRVLEIIAPLTP